MPALRQRHDACAEIFRASAMMAAAAAQFTPTSKPWMQELRPTWRCAWLVVEAGVVALMLSERYRKKFKAVGWEFGASILDVMRCPCCPKDAKPDPDKASFKAGLVEILGDDEGGIAAAMEDLGL
jgi:hypothetical protein